MSDTRQHPILKYLRRVLGTAADGGVPDAELLRRFLSQRDEAAFELLLWRHAAMVLHVCRRLLRDTDAIEDAFQATFLVFVRKAGSIRRSESLGGWLYRVAYRIALKARQQSAKRESVEHRDSPIDLPDASTEDAATRELRRIVCEEVDRLPARYRTPIVACFFEGKTHEEAARQLGWPRGTVASRLARGRELLRRRLVRRGIALTTTALATALVATRSPAALTGLIRASVQTMKLVTAGSPQVAAVPPSVAVLAEGGLQVMFWTRVKIVMVVLLLAGLSGGGTAFWAAASGVAEPTFRAGAEATPAGDKAAQRMDADNVLGLPKPRDARRPGALVLHGGGRITDATFDRFVALAGGKEARIVLVPSAGYRPSDYDSEEQFRAVMRRRFSSWVRLGSAGLVAHFQFLYTDDPTDADKETFVRPLATATGVWFSGGYQTRLNYRFVGRFPQQTKFQTALRGVLERGGVVGGTSAGMAALPEIMTLMQDQRRAAGPLSAVPAHGFGLLTGAIVEQHFDGRNGRLERFTELLRDSPRLDKLSGRGGAGVKMLGLGVEEGTALVVREDRLDVLGEGDAHMFLKSPDDFTIVWHTLPSGNKAVLKRDRGGKVLLLRQESTH